MAFGKVIFNKKGRFHWFDNEYDISLLIGDDLSQEWFIADIFYPDFSDYDTSMHDYQIKELLSKPDELVRFN
ncbi:hypothetical protein ABLB84_01760 [Xenorhabdus szentirmaii]|uniref:hypothetical protein n=1 Tax=Xenorhabdus szentirmaii TaxID=290112 RepID=UPI0032B83148